MNEQAFANSLRRALDESAERLPYRITQRLERARGAAMARALPSAQAAPAIAAPHGGAEWTDGRPSMAFRLLSTVLPLLLVAIALYGIALWDDAQRAADTADIDAELVLGDDELPVAAYADKGFGVYLRNTRQ
jgi:hypothetical protein